MWVFGRGRGRGRERERGRGGEERERFDILVCFLVGEYGYSLYFFACLSVVMM